MSSDKPPTNVIPFARPRRFPEELERLRAKLDDEEAEFDEAELADATACAEAAVERRVAGAEDVRAELLGIRAHRILATGDKEGALAAWAAVLALTPTYVPAYAARAKILGEAGEHATVVAELDRFLTLAPTEAAGYVLRADAYQAMGDVDRALANYLRAAQLDPTCRDAHRGVARQLTAKGDTKGAARAYAKAAQEVLADAESYDLRGLFHFVSGQEELALADYEASLALEPNDADTLAWRGLCRLRLKRYEDAASDFTRLIAMRPGEARGYWRRGEARVFGGKPAAAIADLERAIALDTDERGAVHLALGMAHQALGHTDAARTAYDEAVERAPTNETYRLRRFQLNAAAGDSARCLVDVEAVLTTHVDDETLLFARARLCQQLDRREDALASYDRLAAVAPQNAEVFQERSALKTGMGDCLGARDDAARAFELAPDDLDIRATHARFLAQSARSEADRAAAFALIESAAELDAENPEAWARAADGYNGVSAHAECVRCFTRAIELDPDNPAYYEQRARYRHCAAPWASVDPEGHRSALLAALEDVEQALTLEREGEGEGDDDENLDGLLLRAELTEELGDLHGAIEYYSELIETDPQFIDPRTARARLRKVTGDMPGALADAAAIAAHEEALIAAFAAANVTANFKRFSLDEA